MPTPSLPVACPAAQNDINEKMRAILIDWLVDVHLKFKVRRAVCQRSVALPACTAQQALLLLWAARVQAAPPTSSALEPPPPPALRS